MSDHRHPRVPRRSVAGFTIVELLVVIGVVVILIGVLLPALAGARKAGHNTVCLGNLRSIAMGLTIYANDHDSLYPHWSGWQIYDAANAPPEATGDEPGPGWTELIKDDLDESIEVYRDPARPREHADFAYFLSSRWVYYRTGKLYTSLRRDEVSMPSHFILVADCNQPGLYPKPYGIDDRSPDCDKDDATQPCIFFEGALDPHDGKTNIMFLDGHAGSFAAFDPSVMSYHPRKPRDWSLEPPSQTTPGR